MNSIGITLTVAINAGKGDFNIVAKPTGVAALEAKGKLGEEVAVVTPNKEEQLRVYKLDGNKMVVSINFKDEKNKAKDDLRTWTIAGNQLIVTVENIGQEKGLTMKQVYDRVE